MGEVQEDFGRTWEDLAGLRQEVGWIRQSRADFCRKIADSRGDLVACPDGNLALARWERGADQRNARGPYLTSYQK